MVPIGKMLVGSDLLFPGLTKALVKPLAKSLKARIVAKVFDNSVVAGGGNFIKQG